MVERYILNKFLKSFELFSSPMNPPDSLAMKITDFEKFICMVMIIKSFPMAQYHCVGFSGSSNL